MKSQITKILCGSSRTLRVHALLLLLLLTSSASAHPGVFQTSPASQTPPVADETVALKREVERHHARADFYLREAAHYNEAIELRWQQFRQESKKIAVLPKSVNENPYLKKLRKQAEREVSQMKELRRSAQDLARYHQIRAKELLDNEKDFSSAN